MSHFSHRLQALGLQFLFAVFRALPLDVASFFGGFIGRAVGPWLRAHKTARRNLAMAFPDKSEGERRSLLNRMWNNLGRTAAELAYLPEDALHRRVTVMGAEHLPPPGQPVLFFSGHLGNWELAYPMARRYGIPTTLIYRHANNPYVERIIANLRATQCAGMLTKGARGAFKLTSAIKRGALAMLVDQKMNEGIPVPFFGRDAMTAPAIAHMALRFHMPIIPVRMVRKGGCRFDGILYPPLRFERTGDEEKDARAIMTQINAMLEAWIREHPEQWFWVHKRWPEGA